MRKWMGIPLALLLIIGLHASAWANSEAHTGGRLFFPLWDVSTSNRLTFIVLTRQALREGQTIRRRPPSGPWVVNGDAKCLPRGAGGSTANVNRTDLGGTPSDPVFVDDVHLEYYGRTCIMADEVVHMSCGDTDLFLLSSTSPRGKFDNVAADGRGALDVHLIRNGSIDHRQRKLENSLLGHAIITDIVEGWAATYDAAAAKAVACPACASIDAGTAVGYENYPMEVYLPSALADGSSPPGGGGAIQNSLALWAPALMPGGLMTGFNVDFKWWDGRERSEGFTGNRFVHSINEPLSSVDNRFDVANFVCGHAATGLKAENDGFPRSGTDATDCGAPAAPDPSHKSDNFDDQPSTPMGWWRFQLTFDEGPIPATGPNSVHTGRGLVGVALSSPQPDAKGAQEVGPGVATRLWHEDPCEIAQSGDTIGPPHKGHGHISDEDVALFNTFSSFRQSILCGLIHIQPFGPRIILPELGN